MNKDSEFFTFNDLYVDERTTKENCHCFHSTGYPTLVFYSHPMVYLELFYIAGALSKMNGKNLERECIAAKENWS